MSLAKTLVNYFLPSLDKIIFHYFWKADAFLQNFLQSGNLFICSFILFQTTELLESGADINITDEMVITGKKVGSENFQEGSRALSK